MNKALLITVFIFTYSYCHAQKALTTYFDSGWYLTIKELAQYYRIGVIDTNDYHYDGPVKDYYISGNLQMRGTFVAGAKMDSFFFYYPNGKIKTQGEYWNNKRDGIWVNYYMNGNIQDITNAIRLNHNIRRIFLYQPAFDEFIHSFSRITLLIPVYHGKINCDHY